MKAVGIGLIRLYRIVFAWLPSSCRYEPSCSRYTEQAIQKYGLILADNGSKASPMFITGSSDDALSSALSSGASLIKQITTADLEVADTGPVTQD